MTTIKRKTSLVTAITVLVVVALMACTLSVFTARADVTAPAEINLGSSTLIDAGGGADSINYENDSVAKTVTISAKAEASLFGMMATLSNSGICLDGFSFDVEFKDIKDGDIMGMTFGSNVWVRDNGLGIMMKNNGGKGELEVRWGGGPVQAGTQAVCVAYASPEFCAPSLSHVRGADAGFPLSDKTVSDFIPFSSANVKLNISFKRYSTYRYSVTVTALSENGFDASLDAVTDNAYSFYIYVPDIPDLFNNAENGTFNFGLVTQNAADPSGKMIIGNGLDYGKNKDMIDDGELLPEEEYGSEVLEPRAGNYIVNTKDKWIEVTKSATIARNNENGSTYIACEKGKNPGWGDRVGLGGEYTLNGLSITADYRQIRKSSFFGIIFGNKETPYYNSDSGLALVTKIYENTQVRVYLQKHHDLENSTGNFRRGYRTAADAKEKNEADRLDCIILDSQLPDNGSPTASPKFRYTFEKEADTEGVWKFTLEILDDKTSFNYVMAGERNGGLGGLVESPTVKKASLYFNESEITAPSSAGGEQPALFNDNGHVKFSIASDMNNSQGMMIMHVEQPVASRIDPDKVDVTLENESYEWTGKPVEPAVTQVKVDGVAVPASGYRVSYKNNVNASTSQDKAVVVINFIGDYVGSAESEFSISGIDASAATVVFPKESYEYTGAALKPRPSVKLGGTEIPASSYMSDYKNNTNAGTATVTVTFKGGYTGTATGTFTITKVNVSGEKDAVTVKAGASLKSVTVDKYGAGIYTLKDEKGTIVTDSELSAGKYTATLVVEDVNTVTTYTYTVTVEKKTGCGCGSAVNGTYLMAGVMVLALAAVLAAKRKKREN